MELEVLEILRVLETIAVGSRIREQQRLTDSYGEGRWRKVKGIVRGRLRDGTVAVVEAHWYEAHGVGRFEFKPKFR